MMARLQGSLGFLHRPTRKDAESEATHRLLRNVPNTGAGLDSDLVAFESVLPRSLYMRCRWWRVELRNEKNKEIAHACPCFRQLDRRSAPTTPRSQFLDSAGANCSTVDEQAWHPSPVSHLCSAVWLRIRPFFGRFVTVDRIINPEQSVDLSSICTISSAHGHSYSKRASCVGFEVLIQEQQWNAIDQPLPDFPRKEEGGVTSQLRQPSPSMVGSSVPPEYVLISYSRPVRHWCTNYRTWTSADVGLTSVTDFTISDWPKLSPVITNKRDIHAVST